MKKLLFTVVTLIFMAACSTDSNDYWTQYTEWRNANNEWINNQATLTNPDGSLYYSKIIPAWDRSAYVLIHYFNDREKTAGNLTPLYTSTVSVKYKGELYDGTPFDSSYLMVDSLFTTTPSSVITGWAIALEVMHVGDSCEVLIPYQQAYFTNTAGSIPPYSCLKFNMKLVDIPYYELKP